MKQLIIITCLLCCCAWGYSQVNENPPAPPRKSMSLSPVEVVQGEGSISIRFNQSLGNVSVSIVDQWGSTVYQTHTEAIQGSQLTIHTFQWAAGTYLIRITGEDGLLLKEVPCYNE